MSVEQNIYARMEQYLGKFIFILVPMKYDSLITAKMQLNSKYSISKV